MRTPTTTVRQDRHGVRGTLAMTGVTLALVSGVVFWQLRPTSEVVRPVTSATHNNASNGIAPRGGLAEQYLEEQPAAVSAAAATMSKGGMAELYAEQQARVGAGSGAPVVLDTMGGMAELYRDQQAANMAGDLGVARTACGVRVEPVAC